MAETVKKSTTATKTRKASTKKAAVNKVESIRKAANGQATNGHLNAGPSHEQVAELARKYWAERGYKDGHHEEDWFRAEQELRAKAS